MIQLWEIFKTVDAAQIKELAAHNIPLALTVCFVSGVLTSFTPCIYPMIPITINIFGRASRQDRSAPKSWFNWHSFRLAGVYVAGMCVTYSILGVLAGLSGSLFGKMLQSQWMLLFLTVLFAGLAVSQLGFFKIALPGSLQTKLGSVGHAQSAFGIFVMGLVAGLVVSPCVGPVIGGILAFVFESSNAVSGMLYFLSFSLGLGVLFLLIGGFSGVLNKLPRSGAWMTRINFVLSGLMLIAAGYYGVLFAKQIGWIQTHHKSALSWETQETVALERAAREHLPVVIDFTADWCAACHEIEAQVLSDQRVVEALKGFVRIRLDMTQDTPESAAILQKYGVQGLPAMVFKNAEGNTLTVPRVTGLLDVEKFLDMLRQVKPLT